MELNSSNDGWMGKSKAYKLDLPQVSGQSDLYLGGHIFMVDTYIERHE